ncbi:MAG: hypothetical protein ACODAU_11075 [Myxococcota bacterium]
MGIPLRSDPPPDDLQVWVHPASAAARLGRVLTVAHWAPLVAEEMWTYAEVLADDRQGPDGMGLLVVVEPHKGVPEPGVRAQLPRIHAKVNGRVQAMALVLLGDGFGTVVTRSVLMTINLFPNRSYPMRTFGEVRPAVQWLCARPGFPSERALLEHVVMSRSLGDRHRGRFD